MFVIYYLGEGVIYVSMGFKLLEAIFILTLMTQNILLWTFQAFIIWSIETRSALVTYFL